MTIKPRDDQLTNGARKMIRDSWAELLGSNLARPPVVGVDILSARSACALSNVAACFTHHALAPSTRRRQTKGPLMTIPAIISGEHDPALAAYLFEQASDAKRHGDHDPGDRLWREYLLLAALRYLSIATEDAFISSPAAVEHAATYLENCLDISVALRRQLPLMLRGAMAELLPVCIVQDILKIAIARVTHDIIGNMIRDVVGPGLETIADAIRELAPAREELN